MTMKYIINLIKSLIPIILIYLIYLILAIVISLVYVSLTNNDLESFITNYLSYFLLPYFIIIIIFIFHKYSQTAPPLNTLPYLPCLYLGFSLTLTLNMLLFLLIPQESSTTPSLFTAIIFSSILGPIFEEVVFRYYFFNKLSSFSSPFLTVILNSLIFAIIHNTISGIIFAFFMSLCINLIYNKYHNLISCIIIHMICNFTALFLSEFNLSILLLSLLNLFISILIIFPHSKKQSLISL